MSEHYSICIENHYCFLFQVSLMERGKFTFPLLKLSFIDKVNYRYLQMSTNILFAE